MRFAITSDAPFTLSVWNYVKGGKTGVMQPVGRIIKNDSGFEIQKLVEFSPRVSSFQDLSKGQSTLEACMIEAEKLFVNTTTEGLLK